MPRIGGKLITSDEIATLVRGFEWGFNRMPTSAQLIKALSKFSIIDLYIEHATVIITFSHQLFTLEEMLNFGTTFSHADELDIIGKNKLRIWWD